MRTVTTKRPSFPDAPVNVPLEFIEGERWQVPCGDGGHWRMGFYSPEFGSAADIEELEWHDCPELFLLIEGKVSLVLSDDEGERIVALEPKKPVLVTCRHAGFCPKGPFTGVCAVIERDAFETEYTPR